jgi:hypothetical protein
MTNFQGSLRPATSTFHRVNRFRVMSSFIVIDQLKQRVDLAQ